jgi:hypothetical protein
MSPRKTTKPAARRAAPVARPEPQIEVQAEPEVNSSVPPSQEEPEGQYGPVSGPPDYGSVLPPKTI